MKIKLIILAMVMSAAFSGAKAQSYNTPQEVYNRLHEGFPALRSQVGRPAQGFIRHPYLVPAGFYSQLWDWDAFFMANHFISRGEPQYMKSWVLTFAQGIDNDGYVAGCMTTEGPRRAYSGKFAMKPFLSQGAYHYANATGEWDWLRPIYKDLGKVLDYRRRTQRDSLSGLYFWELAMQSGADNNPALNYFKDDSRSFLAADASAFQYGELLAQAQIARKLGYEADAKALFDEAHALRDSLNAILWNEQDKVYYNIDRETRQPYRRVSYSCFVPLMYGMASDDNGKATITRYMLSEEHLKSPYGLRSLSLQDPDYNNKNIIVPFSNWQGPVWGITAYIYSLGLHRYGFDDAVRWLATATGSLMCKDLDSIGTMHETYNAETGEPLAPSNFKYRNADGSPQGFVSWNLTMENILEGVLFNRWMTLEIPEE